MDDADRAGPLVEAYRADGLKKLARSTLPGTAECVSCGEMIDIARRAAHPGARRCLSCQMRHEKSGT
ncbi:TraR/DksA C4-type zinc finger protein [Kaistia dalseonensis]|uniref:Phage/conjugal plasmid C-4 type zinc finger TraR family protein n=1 Tax=Kaistia dalseonensis TaxID=410840 RepID=A0ABU0HDM7_9HYPH|nr:TraR/DksA C4-type zinc finger protein [Kaistia dalseonensis]MCX5497311.1 TraR/DksA C4-type zinc finger protein [Kaistia dalseonensis]MDQ0439948.1 phage/conjugal plasmid C-4 type zinc finger TraR family protein [Kaistia dalseonensis]